MHVGVLALSGGVALGFVIAFASVAAAQWGGSWGGGGSAPFVPSIPAVPRFPSMPGPAGGAGGSGIFEDPMGRLCGPWRSPRRGCLPDFGTILGQEAPAGSVSVQPDTPNPAIDLKRDPSGTIVGVTNLLDEEVPLEGGLTLGPRASVDLRDGKVVVGYVVRNGIKYTSDGVLENLRAEEVRLEGADREVVMGPLAALDESKGQVLRGYVIAGGRRYEAR